MTLPMQWYKPIFDKIYCGYDCIALSYLTTWERLIGHSGLALPDYTENEMDKFHWQFLRNRQCRPGFKPTTFRSNGLEHTVPQDDRGIGQRGCENGCFEHPSPVRKFSSNAQKATTKILCIEKKLHQGESYR